MPSYFYHLAIELFQHHQNLVADQTGAKNHESYTDALEALAPFRKRAGHSQRKSLKPSKRPLAGIRPSLPASERLASTISSTSSDSASELHHSSLHKEGASSHTNPELAYKSAPPTDQRIDHIYLDCIDMVGQEGQSEGLARNNSEDHVSRGIGSGVAGLAAKGKYVPFGQKGVDTGWGIVHLYRDAEETPGLYEDDKRSKSSKGRSEDGSGGRQAFKEEDCTTLAILAVPSYMPPSDFLGFVGEETRNEVSHFRMIRTSRTNRYMVLMKFRSAKRAREWRREWNGKVFNSMEVSCVARGSTLVRESVG